MKTLAVAALAVCALTAVVPAAAKSKARVPASACPSVSILPDAVRITQLKAGRIDLKAEIRDPAIACSVTGGKAKSKLSFWVKSAISPMSDVSPRNVPYFVAIIVDGQVIGKEVFNLPLAFGADRKLLVKEKVARIDIPVDSKRNAEDYSVTIGFQLTPEQAEYNRTASR